MADPRRRQILARTLVTSEGRATQQFIEEWRHSGARIPLSLDVVVVAADRTPTADFLGAWNAAFGGGALRSINPAQILFDDEGRFTPIGYARWLAAVAP